MIFNRIYGILFLLITSAVSVSAAEKFLDFAAAARMAEEKGDTENAIDMYGRMLDSYEIGSGSASKSEYAESFFNAGNLCYRTQRYVKALDFYRVALKAAREDDDELLVTRCYGNIANIYDSFHDYESAVRYYGRGYAAAERLNDPVMKRKFLSNMIEPYCLTGDTAKAKECLAELRLLPSDDILHHYSLLAAEGAVMSATGHNRRALEIRTEALRFARMKRLNPSSICSQLLGLGRNLIALGKPDSALIYLDEIVRMSADTSIHAYTTNQLLRAYESMSGIYSSLGDTALSRDYTLKAMTLSDSLFNRERFNSSQGKLSDYEDKYNTSRLDILSWRVVALCIVAGVMAVIIVLLLVLIRNRRHLAKANSMLMEKNVELRNSDDRNMQLTEKLLGSSAAANTQGPDEDAAAAVEVEGESVIGGTASVPESKCRQPLMLDQAQVEAIDYRIRKVMEDPDNIRQSDFSLSALAQQVKSNIKYVSWVINEVYGKNFKSFLNDYRIKQASIYLEDTERYGHLTIKAIGEMVGFQSANGFIAAFKKIVGMTPSTYQKVCRDKHCRNRDS